MTAEGKNNPLLWIYIGLAIATVAVYGQVAYHDFVNFDDLEYVVDNANIQRGLTVESIGWAFTSGHASNWHPLTWLSHMLDYQLWGLNPGAFLLTNVFFHVVNTLLLFTLLNRMTGAIWQSAFVAALFALHPLHVESVAWVSERKDVLSTFFWMLTSLLYVRYAERPGASRYALVFVAYAIGLLAKPMLVTLPFVFLLMDYWPLQRFSAQQRTSLTSSPKKRAPATRSTRVVLMRLVQEKIPFFMLIAGSSIVTFIVQQKYGAVAPIDSLPLSSRIPNALVSYAGYLVNMVWPTNLAVFYPYTNVLPGWKVAGSILLLAAISALALRTVRSKPYLIVGWLWYLGTLVPVIGLVQVGTQAMADRYTYITLTGIFIMLAWGAPDILSRWPLRKIALTAMSTVIIAACMVLTFFQIQIWKDSFALYEHAVSVTTGNHLVRNNLGAALFKEGKLQEAKAYFMEALQMNPNDAGTRNNLGAVLGTEKKLDSAIVQYREAIRINPNYVDARKNLGVALTDKGQIEEARSHLAEALRLKPEFVDVRVNYANLLAKEGKTGEAIAQYQEALRLNPNTPEAHSSLAFLFASQSKWDDAISHLSAALLLKPEDADGHTNLGNLLVMRERIDEAIPHFEEALKLKPDLAMAHQGFASALSKKGRYGEAISHYNEALRLNVNDAQSHFGIGVALSKQGKISDAISHLSEALRLKPDFADARTEFDKLKKQTNNR